MHAHRVGRPVPRPHGMQIWCGFDHDAARARERLGKRIESFYKVPFERFERYAPRGTPEAAAEARAPFLEAGCRRFNLMLVAASEEAGIEAVAEVAGLLRAADPS